MEIQFISRNSSDRLILIFAGWAMDAAPFRHLRRHGYDVAVVWDYRDLSLDTSFASRYSEICVFAWSLGVYAAAVTMECFEERITRRVAINGTMYPVDNTRGIPENVFGGTLAGLDERNLIKFYRRVAGSRDRYADFAADMPQRDLAGLREELQAFYPSLPKNLPDSVRWDVALIGIHDAIFPPENQREAWKGVPTEELDEPHLPDFQSILDRYAVDKQRVGERFARGRRSYEADAPVQASIVERMKEMMTAWGVEASLCAENARILEIGCGTGLLTRCLDALCSPSAELEMWDIAGPAPIAGVRRHFEECDAETAIQHRESSSTDVIATASTVQWFNSPARFLSECLRVLRPGGWLVMSTFVEGNLAEVAAATGHGLPLLSESRWNDIIPEGFEITASECYSHSICFESAIDVFRHLKGTGVNSLGHDGEGGSRLRKAIDAYSCGADGLYHATYRPLILLLRKR